MATLTAKQITELANDFLGMAQAVGDYRYQNYGKLTKAQNKQLSDLHWTLLNYSEDLFTQSAIFVLDDVDGSLSQIKDISRQMTETYKQLARIQQVIDISAAAATLGAAIFSKNPVAIAGAVQALVKSIKG